MSNTMINIDEAHLAVVGLGYVGLPLAVAFGKVRPVIGLDISASRIEGLRAGCDVTGEVNAHELAAARHLQFTNETEALAQATIFIIAVPTPVDAAKRPDLSLLVGASQTVARSLKPGDLVIYESTVYPGCTEEVCVPVLEQGSGLRVNADFVVGYSPERINPGDATRQLTDIVKITSGSTPAAGAAVDALYGSIITAGTHKVASIAVAEAAKVIENVQRDINIALINELAIIFHRLGLDTSDVLEAAGTKWNFLPFRPGLVGGHCIGVDPYYLTYRAQQIGHHPDIILAGRRINDGMARFVVDRTMRLMLERRIAIAGSRVLVMGLSFKEDCADLRNSRAVDLVRKFKALHAQVDAFDPIVSGNDAMAQYGMTLITEPAPDSYDAIIIAVAHQAFIEMGAAAIRHLGRPHAVMFDVKGVFGQSESDGRL